MLKVTFTELGAYEEDGCDENAMGYFAAEANACGAFDALGWVLHEDGVSFPDDIDPVHVDRMISTYLSIVDDSLSDRDIEPYLSEAHRYEEATRATRGADDGTYDYCGSFVQCILDSLIQIQEG